MSNTDEFENIMRLLADEDEIPAPNPLRKASARQNYLVHAARLRSQRSRPHVSALQSIFVSFRLALKAMMVVLLVASGLLAGTVYAAADSLPGDLLYPVNLQVEEVQLGWERDPEHAARLALSFAEKRLDEAERLVEAKKQVHIHLALQTYQRIITKPQLTEISAAGGHVEISVVIIETLTSQRERLLEIRSRVALQNSVAFESVINALDIELQRHLLSISTPAETPEDDTASSPDLDNPGPNEISPSDDLGLDGGTPPGLIDNPGLESGTPPGLIDNPGLESGTPPGLIDNPGLGDSVPPGQGGSPPGQDKDDKDKDDKDKDDKDKDDKDKDDKGKP